MEQDGIQRKVKVNDPTKALGSEANKLKVDNNLL